MDIAMTVLLPMLMAYSLIGEKFHEFIGTLMRAVYPSSCAKQEMVRFIIQRKVSCTQDLSDGA